MSGGNDVGEKRFITRKELCKLAGISSSTSYNRQNDDPDFPTAHEFGLRTVRFLLSDVLAWLAAKKTVKNHTKAQKIDKKSLPKPEGRRGKNAAGKDQNTKSHDQLSPDAILPLGTVSSDDEAMASPVPSSIKDQNPINLDVEEIPAAPIKKAADEESTSTSEHLQKETEEADIDAAAILAGINKKLLPIVNSFYRLPDQRTDHLKGLIESAARDGQWISFCDLAENFRLNLKSGDDIWLRECIKDFSEESFKKHGVRLSVLICDDTVFRFKPDYYPSTEFLQSIGIDTSDKGKVLGIAWKEMEKVHRAYRRE